MMVTVALKRVWCDRIIRLYALQGETSPDNHRNSNGKGETSPDNKSGQPEIWLQARPSNTTMGR